MATLKEEQEQLKSKIVESPEELKNSKELMKETVKKLKRSKVRFSSVHTRRYSVRKSMFYWTVIIYNCFLSDGKTSAGQWLV